MDSFATQADSDNSSCFAGRLLGAYLRRNERANSFANRESSSALIITQVWKHNDVSESGFTTTPSPSARISSGRRCGEDGHADVLRYQVNRLLSRNNIVRVFRSDSLTSCGIHDCVMNDGVNSPCQQNPFVTCQILEQTVFLFGGWVGLRESRHRGRLGERHSRDLGSFPAEPSPAPDSVRLP